MNMPFPSRSEAVDFFEWVIAERNKTPYPFRDDMEDTFRRHCHGVAIIAETIASKTPYLNADLAYVMGLLHDCGRIVDEYATGDYHGVVGYHLLCQKRWPQLAKISVTHNFVDKDFDIELMPHPRKDMIFCKNYLTTVEYDDYDRLLQLADAVNNLGNNCTVEQRYRSIAVRYNVAYDKLLSVIASYNKIKHHFDELCRKDVYDLIGVKTERFTKI